MKITDINYTYDFIERRFKSLNYKFDVPINALTEDESKPAYSAHHELENIIDRIILEGRAYKSIPNCEAYESTYNKSITFGKNYIVEGFGVEDTLALETMLSQPKTSKNESKAEITLRHRESLELNLLECYDAIIKLPGCSIDQEVLAICKNIESLRINQYVDYAPIAYV